MDADELRKARQRLKMTQRQLAAELDMTVATISAYETGHQTIKKTVAMAVELLARQKKK